jgi:coenzyme F420-reducing hydrogenase alpha subunit
MKNNDNTKLLPYYLATKYLLPYGLNYQERFEKGQTLINNGEQQTEFMRSFLELEDNSYKKKLTVNNQGQKNKNTGEEEVPDSIEIVNNSGKDNFHRKNSGSYPDLTKQGNEKYFFTKPPKYAKKEYLEESGVEEADLQGQPKKVTNTHNRLVITGHVKSM